MAERAALRIITLSFLFIGLPNLSFAAVTEEIEASAQYVLGDNDSKLDGRRLALLEAKRNALEKAGTYIESFTEVKNFQLTQNQVRSYAAGILEVKEAGEKWDKVGDNLTVTLTVKVKVDKDVVAKQLAALRKNSEATEALEEANRKIREYEQRIAEFNRTLQMAKVKKEEMPPEKPDQAKDQGYTKQVEEILEDRRKALTGIEVENLLAKADLALHGTQDEEYIAQLGEASHKGVDEARALTQRALSLDPEHPAALYKLGILALETKDYSKAEEVFRKAARLHPNYHEAFYGLGMTFAIQGNVAQAEKFFRDTIRLKPDYAIAYIELGHILGKQGNWNGAVQAGREAVHLKPEEGIYHLNLGHFLRGQGNREEAFKEYQEACRLSRKVGRQEGCKSVEAMRSGCASSAAAASYPEMPDDSGRSVDVALLALAGAPLLLARRWWRRWTLPRNPGQ